jgi:hypothetical protein
MDLEGFRRLACSKLDMEVSLPYPFKVCDFRPAFGTILADHLHGFDYWGWGDSDVLYGDVRNCLGAVGFERYDIVSVRSEFMAGELSLLRNTSNVNSLFLNSRDYRRVFTSDQGFDFEEYGFFKGRPVDSFTHVARRAARDGSVRLMLRDLGLNDRKIGGRPFKFYWGDGKLFDLETGDEHLLYHFLDMKKQSSFFVPDQPVDLSAGAMISDRGVESCDRPLKPRRHLLASLKERSRRSLRAWRASRKHWSRTGQG